MQGEEARFFAPATIGNVGPGFDVLGLALAGLGDTVTARRVRAPGVRIVAVRGASRIPVAAEENTAGIAAMAILRKTGIDCGIELEIDKGLPLGSGLGGSAASAAAGAAAVNVLVGSPLRKFDLLEPCLEAEAQVAGRHADNVAPAVLGGLVLVQGLDPIDVIRLPIPRGLQVVMAVPAFEVHTKDARDALPREVSLATLVRNTASVASVVAACFTSDFAALSRAILPDAISRARAKLIPGASDVIEAALSAGAIGCSISGSGPSIFALCRSERSRGEIGRAMRDAFASAGLSCETYGSAADCPGVRRV